MPLCSVGAVAVLPVLLVVGVLVARSAERVLLVIGGELLDEGGSSPSAPRAAGNSRGLRVVDEHRRLDLARILGGARTGGVVAAGELLSSNGTATIATRSATSGSSRRRSDRSR